MRFSFVIPTYQNKKLLGNTLEALNYQDGFGREDYEVIIVDDGSTDGTYDYIAEIPRNYELKYYFLERCSGSCRARTRNFGWKKAVGDIVIFIDSDILVRDNYLREIDRYYSADNELLVVGNRIMLPGEIQPEDIASKDVFRKYKFDNQKYELLEGRYFFYERFSYNASSLLDPWGIVYSCNMAVPLKWLEKAGGFDEGFKGWGLEDVELGFKLHREGIKVVINSRLEVLHQFHGSRNEFIVDESIKEQHDMNFNYFYDKHSAALNMSRDRAYKALTGEDIELRSPLDRGTPLSEKVLEFRDGSSLEELKAEILWLSDMERIDLTVLDYVNDTDLDIWIQLLGKRKSTPKYYPGFMRFNIPDMLKYIEKMRNPG